MNEPIYYFRLIKNDKGEWIRKYHTTILLDPDKIYKTNIDRFEVEYLSKVEVLIAIGKGVIIEELE